MIRYDEIKPLKLEVSGDVEPVDKPVLVRPKGTGAVLEADVRDAPTLGQIAVINNVKAGLQGITPLDLDVGEPVIDGAFVLDFIATILDRYARWATPEEIVITTLWIAHTWFTDVDGNLLLPATPRWLAIAPKGAGKSRMEKLIRALARNAVGPVAGTVSAPGVRNALNHKRVVIIDELHRVFGVNGRRREDLQGILTAGYSPESETLNAKGDDEDGKEIFGPVAMAALPRLVTSTSDLLEDLIDRCFVIRPVQAPKGDKIPWLDEEFESAALLGRNILGLWAAQERTGKVLYPIHSVPDGAHELGGRQLEITLPLLSVADRAVAPEVIAEAGADPRWAVLARKASLRMLLKQGEATKVMDDIRKVMLAMDSDETISKLGGIK